MDPYSGAQFKMASKAFLISHAWEEHYSMGAYDGGAHLNGRRKLRLREEEPKDEVPLSLGPQFPISPAKPKCLMFSRNR